ncbi:Bug family tripartite tricarboxylate transporter substrate binding protein [Rhodovarius lipocyclicus]|uniref:Bug family tripartite tricarboxylate transporter substrate binding protein n=1 Tax=Rhodovarius lipocyclicus TaxID=268410 RepID=UPI00135B9325|nr:tripartite tricarboxylate transporter substrate binding protein [Rhodovarius lipocyclicus]
MLLTRALFGAAALAAALSLSPAMAQDRSARIVSGFAPGGTADLVARVAAEAVAPHLGFRPVVETRTGASGMLALEMVARGPKDGSMVFQCPMGTLTINPELPGAVMSVDPRTALIPVANVALSSYGMVTGARSPYQTVADVVNAARARPGAVTYASAGVGTAQQLSGARMEVMANISMTHVPYRGAAPGVLDLIAGRADFMITNLGDVMGQIQAGELRLLALADPVGVPQFQNAPRIADTIPGLEVAGWFGLCGPAGMAPAAIRQWAEAVRLGLQNPALRQRLLDNGLTPIVEGPEEFATRMQRDREAWGDTIRRANIRAE